MEGMAAEKPAGGEERSPRQAMFEEGEPGVRIAVLRERRDLRLECPHGFLDPLHPLFEALLPRLTEIERGLLRNTLDTHLES